MGQLCSGGLYPVTSQARKSPFLTPQLPLSSHQLLALAHLLDTHCSTLLLHVMSCSPSLLSPPLLVKSLHLTQSIFTCALLLTLPRSLHPYPFLPHLPLTFLPKVRISAGMAVWLWHSYCSLSLTHCLSPSTTTSLSSLFRICCTHTFHTYSHTHWLAGRIVFSYRTPFSVAPLSSMCKWVLWTRLH